MKFIPIALGMFLFFAGVLGGMIFPTWIATVSLTKSILAAVGFIAITVVGDILANL